MRRIASLAGFIVLIWLAISSFAAPEARASWNGSPNTTNMTIEDACRSWEWFSGRFLFWQYAYAANGIAYGANCYHTVRSELTDPYCADRPGTVKDAYQPDGCRPANAAPTPKELGPYCPLCGNPIAVAGGNKFQEVTDFTTATPDKLSFVRYYNSGLPTAQNSILGLGWRSTFDTYLDTSRLPYWVDVHQAVGKVLNMDSDFHGGWRPDQADLDAVLTQAGTVWTLTDSDDTVWTFTQLTPQAPVAVLASIKRRGGYTQTLQYNASSQLTSVTDSYGRALQFTLQNGLLQAMTAPDGSVYQYVYAAPLRGSGSLLARVVKPGQAPTLPPQNYLYENATFPLALTGIVDDNGTRYGTYAYEQYGRPTTTQHANSADAVSVTFSDSDNGRTVTNPLNLQETYQFATVQNGRKVTRIDRAASGSTPATFATSSYDANGFLNSTRDWNGNITNRTNDARGLPLSITTAAGTPQARTVTYTWDATYHLPTQIVEPGRTTNFTYANGLLMTKTQTDTTNATVPYSTNGRTRTWTYTYTPTGLVQTVKGPRSDVDDTVTYGWDASGTLVSVTNALGQQTQITAHDGAGRPLTSVDANGVVTNMTYTPQGWLNTVTVATAGGNAVTTIDHDAEGQVTRITSPDGSFLAYSYDDAHRLVRVSDAFDERIDYTLDAMGGRTLEQISTAGGAAVAKTQSRVFDTLGRLLQGIGAASQTTSYAYDNVGNLAQTTDPLSNVTAQSFDALNRLIQVAAPLSSTTAYGYDAHDNRTSVTDPRGLVTSYVYDGLDNLIQVTSPDTGTTAYVVDDAGNRIQQTDAAGVVVQMSYDALNRLTAKTYPADPAENVTYRYDEPAAGFGVGRLTGVSDTSGSTAYVYDARGNVVQETHVIGAQSYITSYAYDLADHVAQITYPSGRIVTYTRDAMGRISDVATQDNSLAVPVAVASSATYAPFGPLTALTYGNGLGLSVTYDQDYQPSARLVAGASSVQDLAYGVDADGNITGITDHLATARSQIFQYDALNRLTYASGLYGALAYGYDAVGNRTSQSGGTTNLAETYTYAANSNQLLSVANGGTTRSLVYSPTGNLATDNRGSGTALSFTYDFSDRMVQVANQNQPLATYAYNFLGQRATKSMSASVTHFLYDRAGHLLAESNGATGSAQTEYLWLDEMPLALVTAGNLYFIHPDHLGMPQKATDATQNLAWDIVPRPFDQTEQQTFPILSNLRFPGQYFDSESGLAQNWFRDYDPSIGRYVESDPIGLDGGSNTYAYVADNPLTFIDPHGLTTAVVGRAFHFPNKPKLKNGCNENNPYLVMAGGPKGKWRGKSPRFTCPWCGAPHAGGDYPGAYCPDCEKKSQDPNGGVPPNPNAPNPAQYAAPLIIIIIIITLLAPVGA